MPIEDFGLSGKSIYSILKEKEIEYLYHANTLSTSVTFIENKALLSRHYVESKGLFQTEQKSDSEDIKYDVWNHVFLDGADLHKKYKRANKYGPILFRLKLEILTSPSIKNVFVTKSNPWYWKDNTSINDKFYSNFEDVKKDYLTEKKLDSQIMFTLRNPENNIKLNKYLHSIGLDKPKLLVNIGAGKKITAGDYLELAIKKALNNNGLGHIPVLSRQHKNIFCACHANYNYLYTIDKTEFQKRFATKKD